MRKNLVMLPIIILVTGCATLKELRDALDDEQPVPEQKMVSSVPAQTSTPVVTESVKSEPVQNNSSKEITVFSDSAQSYMFTYPDQDKYETVTTDKKDGAASVKFFYGKQQGKWYGGGIGLAESIVLGPYLKKGKLEFYIKSSRDTEKTDSIRMGWVDNNKVSTWVKLNKYLAALNTQWQKVSVPVAEFPNKGYTWQEGKKVDSDFNWAGVVQFELDFGGGDGQEHTIYFDEIKVNF